MSNGILANAIGMLPQQVAPAPMSVWQHDPAQEEKYGGDYLTDLAERCDAFIEEQARVLGYTLAPGQDNVDLDAGNAPGVTPRIADMRKLTRKREELSREIDYVDNLQDLPEHYVIAYKARAAARKLTHKKD